VALAIRSAAPLEPWKDPAAQPFLRIEGITKTFGKLYACDDISLDVYRGEFFALLGGSGSGKSTLLRILAGLETPDRGRVLIDGVDVTALPPYQRPVNMMFQSYALFPHMNVVENVMYGLRMSGQPKEQARTKAVEALRGVGLGGYDDRRPSELSGGQQQRVALARALVLEPEVLLFDEPLSNLDARLRREMREEIRALQQRLSLTVAYVTHDQAEAMAVSDQIIVMNQGLIAQKGSPRALYETPHSEFVAGFMGEAMLFPAVAGADSTVALGPLVLRPRMAVQSGPVKVAVRPEAWRIHRQGTGLLPARLDKRAYLGAVYEYTFETALGHIFVVSSDLDDVLAMGDEVQLSLGAHGVSVVGSTEAARTNAE